MATFQYKSGLGHTAAYQVSGKPFVTGGLSASARGTTPTEVKFPAVTKSITFSNWMNNGGAPAVIRVGFSAAGVEGNNYISLSNTMTTPVTLDVKATSVFITGEDAFFVGTVSTGSIYASLTSIDTLSIPNNWSGSTGIG
jgi:hypothetical protein